MAILRLRDKDGNVTEVLAIKGKSAYSYAQDGGYSGTEEEFADQLATVADYIDPVVPSFWEESVNHVITTIKALHKEGGKNCITFPFFSDNHQRNGYAGILIKKVMDECHIPYCFYGGDSISSGYIADEATMIEQDRKFDNMMSVISKGRFKRAVGNHDGYWCPEAGNYNYYTRPQVYDLFLREESIAQNMNFGDDGTYYYVDDIASKTRFIVLNANKIMVDNVGTGHSFDSVQLTWLQNIALKFNESGWAIVFISHQPISNHYHASISNAQEVRTIIKNYIDGTAENKADVIGWFSGHIHRDRIYTGIATNTTDDTEGDSMGFTQVTITSDHTGIAYENATLHTVAEDNLSHAIDFVTINKSTKIVNLTRLGIGNNRVYSYTESVQLYSITRNLKNCTSSKTDVHAEEGASITETYTANSGYTLDGAYVSVTMDGVDISSNYSNGVLTIDSVTGNIVIDVYAKEELGDVSYTNLVPTSLAYDSDEVFNDVGYKNNAYYSTSSGANGSSSGMVLTGLIPYTVPSTGLPKTIYIKNAEYDMTSSVNRIAFFDTEKTYKEHIAGNIATYYTVETLDEKYYKLTPKYHSTNTSVSVLYNTWSAYNIAYINFSLIGTGENLIITFDEEITDGDSTQTEIPIVWNEGYKCSYTVGGSYDLTADSSYCTSDVIEVEAGTTYTLSVTSTSSTKLRFVGADDNGIVTEVSGEQSIVAGDNTFTFTPSSGTTQMRLRSYASVSGLDWKLTKVE